MSRLLIEKLGNVATLQRGFDLPVQDRLPGHIPIYAANGPIGFHQIARVAGPGVVTGRSGSIGKVHYVEDDFWPLNTSLYVRDFHGNHPKYIYWLLRQMRLEQYCTGTGVPTLNRNVVHEVQVPLPPVPEQHRVAAILDQADALRAKRVEIVNRLSKLSDAMFVDMFGDVVGDESAGSAPLGDLVEFYSGSTPSKNHPEYWHGDIPWFSPKDVKRQHLWDSADHLAKPAIGAASVKMIPADTVVIVVRGMILAHTVPISLVRVPAAINQDLKALLPRAPINSYFLQAALHVQRRQLLNLVSTAAHGTKRIETQSLRAVRIPRPGEAAEHEFYSRVRRSEQLAENMTKSASAADELFEALQARAFSGNL